FSVRAIWCYARASAGRVPAPDGRQTLGGATGGGAMEPLSGGVTGPTSGPPQARVRFAVCAIVVAIVIGAFGALASSALAVFPYYGDGTAGEPASWKLEPGHTPRSEERRVGKECY